jgi:hypothetical protein
MESLDGLAGGQLDAGHAVVFYDAAPEPDGSDAAGPDGASGAGAQDATSSDGEATEAGSLEAGAADAVDEPPLAPIAFVQLAVATPAGTHVSVGAPFGKPQSAGDLNVVIVGWNDVTTSVASVADSAGNTYVLAVGATHYSPDLSQSIYYARNVAAASANTVTVTFGAAANVVDLRIAEYSGLDPLAPLDAVTAASGKSAGPASSGSKSTGAARELLVGAGMSTDVYSGAGAGFTGRVVTPDGDLLEDRIVSAVGSYAADAPLAISCGWVMQLATFH